MSTLARTDDSRNQIATSVYLSTKWHGWRKPTIQRCTDKDMSNFKTWVHVLMDHGGRVGFKNVTLYFHRKQTQQVFIDVLEEPSVLSTATEKRKCNTDNATVPYFPAYTCIVEILCNRSSKLPNVITPSYDRLSTESKAVCEICGCLIDFSFCQVCVYNENVTHSKDTEEYRIKYNSLLLGIAMFLMFSLSTLRVLQRKFRVKIL
ncbi:uncharacterized protein LOC128174256 [Crassostrea angulata]|uniref:uncharacterized protein LOC128174256 n=1 Tax=Magallana angulata TaxID=2784310 RepID=UPI0022B16702|nr:uncharacterized protein LOC128174256 [Crassostrea angulata]